MTNINLFCFPFAGGSKYSYTSYIKLAPSYIKVIPVDYPGRGGRFNEALLVDLDAIITDSYNQIRSSLKEPYAFYGHSMGTMISFLVTKRIIQEGLPRPRHIFLSGRAGPSVADPDPPKHLLPRDEFRSKLKEMGGSPDEVLNDEDLMDFFEPILRADFQALEKYKYQESTPLNIPLTIMIGLQEKVKLEEARAWEKETTQRVDIRQFPGKHFFIFDYAHEIMKIIGQKLVHNGH